MPGVGDYFLISNFTALNTTLHEVQVFATNKMLEKLFSRWYKAENTTGILQTVRKQIRYCKKSNKPSYKGVEGTMALTKMITVLKI